LRPLRVCQSCPRHWNLVDHHRWSKWNSCSCFIQRACYGLFCRTGTSSFGRPSNHSHSRPDCDCPMHIQQWSISGCYDPSVVLAHNHLGNTHRPSSQHCPTHWHIGCSIPCSGSSGSHQRHCPCPSINGILGSVLDGSIPSSPNWSRSAHLFCCRRQHQDTSPGWRNGLRSSNRCCPPDLESGTSLSLYIKTFHSYLSLQRIVSAISSKPGYHYYCFPFSRSHDLPLSSCFFCCCLVALSLAIISSSSVSSVSSSLAGAPLKYRLFLVYLALLGGSKFSQSSGCNIK
jgi:hypothetical protein